MPGISQPLSLISGLLSELPGEEHSTPLPVHSGKELALMEEKVVFDKEVTFKYPLIKDVSKLGDNRR